MAVQFSRRRSPADATATSLRRARSRFWKRSAIITRACMGKLLMQTGTRSWQTRTQTCRSRMAEDLSRRRCLTLCDSTAETECTPDIYRVMLLRTAASACRSNTPLHFSMPCRSALPSRCSAGRQSIGITQVNRNNRVFRAVRVSAHSWAPASHLRPRRERGGVNRISH